MLSYYIQQEWNLKKIHTSIFFNQNDLFHLSIKQENLIKVEDIISFILYIYIYIYCFMYLEKKYCYPYFIYYRTLKIQKPIQEQIILSKWHFSRIYR